LITAYLGRDRFSQTIVRHLEPSGRCSRSPLVLNPSAGGWRTGTGGGLRGRASSARSRCRRSRARSGCRDGVAFAAVSGCWRQTAMVQRSRRTRGGRVAALPVSGAAGSSGAPTVIEQSRASRAFPCSFLSSSRSRQNATRSVRAAAPALQATMMLPVAVRAGLAMSTTRTGWRWLVISAVAWSVRCSSPGRSGQASSSLSPV